MTRTINEINERIASGEASVLTATEFKERVASGETPALDEVDVVTTGTFGVMSGTMAVLCVPVAPKCAFERADRAWLNGVPAAPGPCPNERLGLIDVVVYGTSRADDRYGGGHLFRDLVAGRPVEVEVEAHGRRFRNEVTIADFGQARLMTTRLAFKNYMGLVNPSPTTVASIFSVTGLTGPFTEVTVSGCGDINPLQNDPGLRTVGVGTRVLLNGGIGYLMGEGTRSSAEKPNVAAFGDMKEMDPAMMGGMRTAHGPECLTSLAVPIPVLDEGVLAALAIRNGGVPLTISDINGRVPCGYATYADVWDGTDHVIRADPESCIHCQDCAVLESCPTGAIGGCAIDPSLCINCGTCVRVCRGGAFVGRLGSIVLDGRTIPISLRQSDRARGEALCTRLRDRLLSGDFALAERLAPLR